MRQQPSHRIALVQSTALAILILILSSHLFKADHVEYAAVCMSSAPPLPNASILSSSSTKQEESFQSFYRSTESDATIVVSPPFLASASAVAAAAAAAGGGARLQEESCLYYTSRWLLVLNWTKEFVKRVLCNKGYGTNPFLLGIMPLFVGILMGWFLATYSNGSLVWTLNVGLGGALRRKSPLRSTASPAATAAVPTAKDNGTDDTTTTTTTTKADRDEQTRQTLQSTTHVCESGVDPTHIPKHMAVIMDGNRRYGRSKYHSAARGHEEGSRTLLNFIQWCMMEHIQILTVYAFSTENWQRSPVEVTTLMDLIVVHVEELRTTALERGICVNVLSTETEPIPKAVSAGIQRLVQDTKHGTKFILNICLSYGSRGEIVQACRAISYKVQCGTLDIQDISTSTLDQHLLTASCGTDPDLILRTSGEYRLSNFLLWQSAYSELFFLDKTWPEVGKEDLIAVIRKFAKDRKRRYGK